MNIFQSTADLMTPPAEEVSLFALAFSAVAKNASLAPQAATTPLHKALIQRNHWSELRGQVISQGHQDAFLNYVRIQPRSLQSLPVKKSSEFSQPPRFFRRASLPPSPLRRVSASQFIPAEKTNPAPACMLAEPSVEAVVAAPALVEQFQSVTSFQPPLAAAFCQPAAITAPSVTVNISTPRPYAAARQKKSQPSHQPLRSAVFAFSQTNGKVVVTITAPSSAGRAIPIKRKGNPCASALSHSSAKRALLQHSIPIVLGVTS